MCGGRRAERLFSRFAPARRGEDRLERQADDAAFADIEESDSKSLERHLAERYGELFAAEFDVLLYELTSSYVERTAPKGPMMRRGYSRHRRPDRKQAVTALIVNAAPLHRPAPEGTSHSQPVLGADGKGPQRAGQTRGGRQA